MKRSSEVFVAMLLFTVVSAGVREAAAMYAAELGRFITRDPREYNPGDMNLYRYVRNNVVTRTDPTGLDPNVGMVGGRPVTAVSDAAIKCACNAAYPNIGPVNLDALAMCKCLVWVQRQQHYPTDWLDALPNCPCSIGKLPSNPDSNTWYEPEEASHTYHPGASHCIRSKRNSFGRGQQCCYDDSGDLITGGLGAGTPDRSAPSGWWPFPHYRDDVTSFERCRDAGMVQFYMAYRLPNNGNHCKPNVVTPF